MAKLGISTGSVPNDGTGDSLLAAGVKINNNFDEVYTLLGDGTNLSSGIVTSIVAGVGITLSGSSGSVTVTVEPSIVSAGGTWDSSSSVGIYTSKSVGIGTTNPLEKLTVGGNVFATELIGIGTRPTFPLHIRSNPGAAEPSIVVSPFSTARPAAIRLTNGSESNFILGLQNSSGNGDLLSFPAYSGVVGLSSNNPLIFVTNGIEGFRLSESGNLGLNRNAPTSKLDVFGDAKVSGVVTATAFVGSGVGLTGVSANYTNTAGISTSVVGGIASVSSLTVSGVSTLGQGLNVPSNYGITMGADGSPTTGEIRIYNGASPTDYFQIYATGNESYIRNTGAYGQGVNINATGSVSLGGGGSGGYSVLAESDGSAILALSSVQKLRTLGAGVTVSGTTFTNQLSVSGIATVGSAITITGSTGNIQCTTATVNGDFRIKNGGWLLTGDGSSTGGVIVFGDKTAGDYYLSTNYLQQVSLGIYNGGNLGYRLFVDTNGNVALGPKSNIATPSPEEALTIYNASPAIRFNNTTSLTDATIGESGGNIYTLDNVGIGTTNAVNKLTVNGNISLTGIVTATSGIVTYYGDASYIVSGRWTVTGDGYDFSFVGVGLSVPTNDPVLYFARGCTYHIVNNSGDHPLEIRDQANGFAYNNGVVGNGQTMTTVKFTVPLDAPNTLYYQCTNHAGMGNTIRIYPDRI